MAATLYDIPVKKIDGSDATLGEHRGEVLLIVNVASKCGLTPQYEGLEKLHEKYRAKKFSVLGFPANDFAGQEPGSDEEIQQFCSTTYQVSFPVFAKIDVNGAAADPLYRYLRSQAPGDFGPQHGMLYDHVMRTRPEAIGTDEIKWNFTKFLIDRRGNVTGRYEPTVTPEQLRPDVDALLAAEQ